MALIGPMGVNQNAYSALKPQQGVYGGIQNHGVQAYMPIMEKRELAQPEQKEIQKGLSNWWPKIGAGYATPMPELLASPAKSATLSGLVLGLIGAGGGMAIARNGIGAAIGGILTGGFGAVVSYIGRRQQNENLLDLMQRLPQGATKRDLLSDPVYQSDLNRRAMQAGNHGGDSMGNLLTGMVVASAFNNTARGSRRR